MSKTAKTAISVCLAAILMLGNAGCQTEKSVLESAQTAETSAQTAAEAEPETVHTVPEWTASTALYEVNVRQYTQEGTFNAFAEHLEEIRDLGVKALWFMPIYPISKTKRSGVLGSYYSIIDYRAVNEEFGTEEDFKALVDKAHEMGFHVMLDWVANHTGWDSTWITEHPGGESGIAQWCIWRGHLLL